MLLSSILLKLPTSLNEANQSGLRRLMLGQQELVYRLRRTKRRTIGFVIDDQGLRITAPKWVAIGQIDAAIYEKQQWILIKLEAQKQRAAISQQRQFEWCDGARLPYLGTMLTLKVVVATKGGTRHEVDGGYLTLFLQEKHRMLQEDEMQEQKTPAQRMQVQEMLINALQAGRLPINHLQRDSMQIQRSVQVWLKREARQLFTTRLKLYADKLGVTVTGLALSSATTRWGSCSTDGKIRLNWRLIYFPLPLIDYVVAHEVAHLREMNHSPLFWAVVQSIYPDYVAARKALRAHTLGNLPNFA